MKNPAARLPRSVPKRLTRHQARLHAPTDNSSLRATVKASRFFFCTGISWLRRQLPSLEAVAEWYAQGGRPICNLDSHFGWFAPRGCHTDGPPKHSGEVARRQPHIRCNLIAVRWCFEAGVEQLNEQAEHAEAERIAVKGRRHGLSLERDRLRAAVDCRR